MCAAVLAPIFVRASGTIQSVINFSLLSHLEASHTRQMSERYRDNTDASNFDNSSLFLREKLKLIQAEAEAVEVRERARVRYEGDLLTLTSSPGLSSTSRGRNGPWLSPLWTESWGDRVRATRRLPCPRTLTCCC